MKGDVGMSLNEKGRNKKMPTPRHKVTHNPLPTPRHKVTHNPLVYIERNKNQTVYYSSFKDSRLNSCHTDHTTVGLCDVNNPRHACTARVTVLGLSVCHPIIWQYRERDGLYMTATNHFRVARFLIGRFS